MTIGYRARNALSQKKCMARLSYPQKKACLLVVFMFSALPVVADDSLAPPWAQEDVVRAALEIRMTETQSLQFKAAISRYLIDTNTEIRKLVRRNPTGLPRKIRSKKNIMRKRMDAEMASFLTESQMSRYYLYRDLLIAKMENKKLPSDSVKVQIPDSHG